MNKAELTVEVASRAGLSRSEATRAVDAVWETIERVLGDGGDVSIAGFGKFHVGVRAARAGVNPRTGEPIQIASSRVPRFTAGTGLKGAVRGR
ncbi:MAG TPA: HU family DNA-binding protein [Solirubrobacteraceae bacterium]|nr:HU family DNA-binding protein [Solirubrobacteraceae bacterium]